jgi:hypothetical protein
MLEMPESWCENKPEYVLCAAIYFDDGKHYEHQPKNISSGFVITGRRHHNCYTTLFILSGKRSCDYKNIQGFLTSKDRFLDRVESYHLAVKSEQIKDDSEIKSLHSEDVW